MYKEVALSFYVEARIPEICAFSNIAQRLKARIRLEPKGTSSLCIPPMVY